MYFTTGFWPTAQVLYPFYVFVFERKHVFGFDRLMPAKGAGGEGGGGKGKVRGGAVRLVHLPRSEALALPTAFGSCRYICPCFQRFAQGRVCRVDFGCIWAWRCVLGLHCGVLRCALGRKVFWGHEDATLVLVGEDGKAIQLAVQSGAVRTGAADRGRADHGTTEQYDDGESAWEGSAESCDVLSWTRGQPTRLGAEDRKCLALVASPNGRFVVHVFDNLRLLLHDTASVL